MFSCNGKVITGNMEITGYILFDFDVYFLPLFVVKIGFHGKHCRNIYIPTSFCPLSYLWLFPILWLFFREKEIQTKKFAKYKMVSLTFWILTIASVLWSQYKIAQKTLMLTKLILEQVSKPETLDSYVYKELFISTMYQITILLFCMKLQVLE